MTPLPESGVVDGDGIGDGLVDGCGDGVAGTIGAVALDPVHCTRQTLNPVVATRPRI